jgi:hypothetical protein
MIRITIQSENRIFTRMEKFTPEKRLKILFTKFDGEFRCDFASALFRVLEFSESILIVLLITFFLLLLSFLSHPGL